MILDGTGIHSSLPDRITELQRRRSVKQKGGGGDELEGVVAGIRREYLHGLMH